MVVEKQLKKATLISQTDGNLTLEIEPYPVIAGTLMFTIKDKSNSPREVQSCIVVNTQEIINLKEHIE